MSRMVSRLCLKILEYDYNGTDCAAHVNPGRLTA